MAVIRCDHGAHLGEYCGFCDDIVQRPRDPATDYAYALAEAKAWMIDQIGFDAVDVQAWTGARTVMEISAWYAGGWIRFVADGMAHQGGEC